MATTTAPPRRRQALVALALGFGVVQLDVTAVTTALRALDDGLGGGVGALQWVVDAYALTFAAGILSAGALGDRLGARRVFAWGFALFVAASAVCAGAPSIGALIAARAVQGVGAAVLVPCSLSLLTAAYPDRAERARAVGLWAAAASVALSGGPLAGGLLTELAGWRAIFLVNVPLGLVALWLTRRAVPHAPRGDAAVDPPGLVTSALALGLLAAGLVQGGRAGFGSPLVLGALVAAAGTGLAFVAVERRRARPMLPPALLAVPGVAIPTAIGLLVNVAFYGLVFVLSLVLQDARGLSPLDAGLALLPTTVAVLLANVLADRVARRIGAPATLVVGSALVAAGLAALLGVDAGTSFAVGAVPLVALGAGLGLVVPTMTGELLAHVDPARAGVGSGLLNAARQTGSVVGVALFGSFLHAGLVPGLHLAAAVGAGLALACAGLALALRAAPA